MVMPGGAEISSNQIIDTSAQATTWTKRESGTFEEAEWKE